MLYAGGPQRAVATSSLASLGYIYKRAWQVSVLNIAHYIKYASVMSPRMGRPRTGERPNISIRIYRDVYHQAKIGAVVASRTIGEWLEDAIKEKIERDRSKQGR